MNEEAWTLRYTDLNGSKEASGKALKLSKQHHYFKGQAYASLSLAVGYFLRSENKEALELCRATDKKIDLILSDVIMLGMSGVELIEILGQERPEMKPVLMSGYTDDIISKHGVSNGDILVLNKPLFPGTLAHRIRELLDEK